ncbi:MAG: hypothetical protein IIC23_01570 [Chloroflexi bacterium]|nr:hypothetical protein [Chloroflexota bacterium]
MAIKSAVAAACVALLLALLPPVGVAYGDEPAEDDFDGGAYNGGTGWSGGWQTVGDVDIVNDGSVDVGSWHMRMKHGNGIAYRDVDLSGLTELELTVWAKSGSFESGEYVILLVGPPDNLVEVNRWVADAEGEGETDADGEYHPIAIDLEAIDTSGPIRIQFESHLNDEDDLFYIDSVVVVDGQASVEEPVSTTPSTSNAFVVLDSEFADWSGKANISDAVGDADKDRGDIVAFYWGDNPDDDRVYWMVERVPGQKKLARYSLHLDMNNDGDFQDSVDRIVEVKYRPRKNNSKVDVRVRRADNHQKIAEYKKNDWGESKEEGGSRVEFGVPMTDLGFSFGSAFRMYVESNWDDRAPDSGDIQWSPMPILGMIGMAALLLGGGGAVWWFKLRRYDGVGVPQT